MLTNFGEKNPGDFLNLSVRKICACFLTAALHSLDMVSDISHHPVYRYAYMCVYMYAYVCTCVRACILCIFSTCVYVYMHTYMYIRLEIADSRRKC